MRTINILKVALTAALLSSCSLYKNYQRPADISTDGIYGDAQSGDEKGLGDIQWREIFTDPQLQALIEKGLKQTAEYMDLVGTVDEGHLIIFDRTQELTWEERLWHKSYEYQGRTIMVWGM